MRKLLLTILTLSWIINHAQVSGTVTDEVNSTTLTGAHISIKELKLTTATNYEGKYGFSGLPAGSYTFQTSYVGYKTAERSVIIKENTPLVLDFSLTPQVYQAEEAVITGSRVQVSRNNNPLTVSVVTREELDESGESAILPVVSDYVPGVFVTERGITGFGVSDGSAGQVSIRGISGTPNTRVLMLIDGHPQFMGIFGHPLPDSYVSSDAEKVEVIRGPASLLYGSNAMGGVINIITRKQQQDGLSANARIAFGSYLTQKYMGSIGYKKNKFSVFVSANHDETQGHRPGSEFYINNGYLKAGYRINANFKLNIDGSIAKFKSYDPGTVEAPNTDPRHWVDILRGMASVSLENSFRNAEGEIKYYYNFGEHDIYDGFHSTDHNQGLMMYESFRPSINSTVTVGFDYQDNAGYAEMQDDNGNKISEITDKSVSEAGTYVYYQQGVSKWMILTGGLRWQVNENYGDEWIPQIGASFPVTANTTIKASASKGYRSPTLRELYLWAPANPSLKPESMWNYELGWLQKFFEDKANLEITTFYSEGKNLIMTVGQFPNVLNENTGSFRHYGIEFLGRVLILKNLSLNTNYSFLHMDDPVTGAPVHKFFLGAKYTLKKFTFNANVSYIGELYTRIRPSESTEYYTILNARVSYGINRYLKVFLYGDNLLDTQYQINYGYPMPGTTVMGGIEFSLTPGS